MTTTQADRLAKARLGVILSAPFFGSLLMRLRTVRDDAQPTLCTNGEVIRYNEAFAATLDDAELRGVLAHEVAHCAQGHLWRQGARDGQKWNHATDYAINEMLTAYVEEDRAAFAQKHGQGGRYLEPWKLPEGGLRSPEFAGMASEEIYARLPDGEEGQKPSPGAFEEPEPSQDPGELEREWQVAVTQAVAAARTRGSVPASVQRLVEELLAPKVPWREVLREFIRRVVKDDYSWTRPNRRYLHAGVVLPSLHSERMGRLAIAVDTSGSIGETELAEFQAEVQAALDECQPEAIEVIYCDAAIQQVEEVRPGDEVRLTPHGGGGTAFEPVFEHLKATEEEPVALIYLTDGHGSFPEAEPEYPVLWASTDREHFPFGQVVALK